MEDDAISGAGPVAAINATGSGFRPKIGAPTAFRRFAMQWTGERLLWLLLVAFVICICIVPLIFSLDAAFYQETDFGLATARSLAAIIDVYGTMEYYGYLWASLVLGVIVTALSVGIGVTMAMVIARTDIAFKRTLDLLVILPLFLSPFIGLVSWIALGSAHSGFINGLAATLMQGLGMTPTPIIDIWSYAGIVWVMVLFFAPFCYLFTVGNLRSMDASLEESARTSGASPMQTLLRITVPMSMPAILSSALLVFLLSIEMYPIPGTIGTTIGYVALPWQIYQDSTGFPTRFAHAAAASTLLLLVALVGIWLQRRITRRAERFVTVTGKGFNARPLPLGKWAPAAFILFGAYILAADILPFGALIASALMKYSAPTITPEVFTLQHFIDIFTMPNVRSAMWTTIWLAVLSGLICVAVGALISYMEVRRASIYARILAYLAVLPVAIPGITYAVGLLWVFLRTPLYGSSWVLLVAYLARFLPYAVAVSRSGVLQIHPDLEQSARMTGASSLAAIRLITLPLLKPTLIAILFFVMLMSMKELSASVLLASQRSPVLSVLTWQYTDSGDYQFASALGVVQSVMMMVLIVITRAVFRVKLEKTFGT
jgi:iron(III) transport system permease protein